MDFSGIGMSLIACCFMTLVPPIPAGMAFFAIYSIQKSRGMALDRTRSYLLFAALYAVSMVVSCFYIYFSYLQYMYVM